MAYPNSGPTLGYVYDAAGRLVNMTQSPCNPYYDGGGLECGSTIATATYTASNQINTLAWDGVNEARTYNNLLQVSRITTNGWVGSPSATYQTIMDMQYVFPSGSNNGQVSQTIDGVTGETVNYGYDALNRLTSAGATSSLWGNSYVYDGFGNLTNMNVTAGSAPSLSVSFDLTTNRPSGYYFDANGLSLGSVASPNVWDVENRMITSSLGNYVYDPSGKRVESGGTPIYYFYGLGGKKMAAFTCTGGTCSNEWVNVYFGGKLLRSKGVTVATDRAGTVRGNVNGESMAYFPYGAERTSTANGREKFGTYTRDGAGQDYADARYYDYTMGRFWSPDPDLSAVVPNRPTSWGSYLYALANPVNLVQVAAGASCSPDDTDCLSYQPAIDGSLGGSSPVTATPVTGPTATASASGGTAAVSALQLFSAEAMQAGSSLPLQIAGSPVPDSSAQLVQVSPSLGIDVDSDVADLGDSAAPAASLVGDAGGGLAASGGISDSGSAPNASRLPKSTGADQTRSSSIAISSICGSSAKSPIISGVLVGGTIGAIAGCFTGGIPSSGLGCVPGSIAGGTIGGMNGFGQGVSIAVVCWLLGAYR